MSDAGTGHGNETDLTSTSPRPESPVSSLQQHPSEQPPLPFWYPKWKGKPIYHGNGEAFGWALDSIGRAVAFAAAGAFLFTALLKLAKEDAGCETEPPEGSNKVPDCHGRVYGIKPSSLLTSFLIVVGVVSALLLPLFGAIVDFTHHRLIVGKVTSVILCVLLLPSLAISSETWFAIALLQLVVAFVGWLQTLVTYAYLPELTKSEKQLNQYTKSFTILAFLAMLLILGIVVGVSTIFGFGDDDVNVARFGQALSFLVTSPALYLAWFRFLRPRPASQEVPEGQSVWTAGFRQVYKTSIYIFQNLPALKWFYTSVAFTDAGVGALATVAITYMTDTLAMSTTETGIAFLCILVGSIPGAMIAGVVTAYWDPAKSSMTATLVLAGATIAAALWLKGPGQQLETYLLAFLWGAGGGWKWTTDRVLASTLIPQKQDAHLMGVYLFAGQVLTWLPPLVFTAMNEAGVSQRVGIGLLSLWFFLGVICLLLIGDYRTGVTTAGRGDMFEHDNEACSEIQLVQRRADERSQHTKSQHDDATPSSDPEADELDDEL